MGLTRRVFLISFLMPSWRLERLIGLTLTCPCNLLGRYSVVPLSTNSGLIEWVPRCDTLHTLVRAFRLGRNVLLNIEHRLMLHFAPDLEFLTLLQVHSY